MDLPFGINQENLKFTKVYEIEKVASGLNSLAIDNNIFQLKKAFLSPIVRELANSGMIIDSIQTAIENKNFDIVKTLIDISEKYFFEITNKDIQVFYNKAMVLNFTKILDYFDNKYSVMESALKEEPSSYANHPDYYEYNPFLHAVWNLKNPDSFLNEILNSGKVINLILIERAFINYCINHEDININIFIDNAEIRTILSASNTVKEYLSDNNMYGQFIKQIEMINLKEKLESSIPLKEDNNKYKM